MHRHSHVLMRSYSTLPLLFRASIPVTAAAFIVSFHLGLPRPTRLYYSSRISRGWKTGTKLIFDGIQPGLQVVFVLEEGKHDRFSREGNDLKTTVTIGKTKARRGCKLFLDPLGEDELPIIVDIKRGEIIQKHQTIRVPGRGWPKSNGGKGDLLVAIQVVSDAKAERLKKKKVKNA